MKRLILIFLVIGFISCQNDKKEMKETRKTVLLQKAKEETLSRLKNPSSAIFIDSLASISK